MTSPLHMHHRRRPTFRPARWPDCHATPARRFSGDGLRHVHGDPISDRLASLTGPGRLSAARMKSPAQRLSDRRGRDDPARISGSGVNARFVFLPPSASRPQCSAPRQQHRSITIAYRHAASHRRRHDPSVFARLRSFRDRKAIKCRSSVRCTPAPTITDGRRPPERHLSRHGLFRSTSTGHRCRTAVFPR